MAINRYRKDYSVTEYTDRNGKIRRGITYTGDPWEFSGGRERAKQAGRRIGLLVLMGWAFFLGALSVNTTAMRTLYVALPFAFAGLPLGLLTRCLFDLLWMDPVITGKQADRLNNYYPAEAFFLTVLTAFALLGDGFVILRGRGRFPADLVFVLCAAGLLVTGYRIFAFRKSITLEKAGQGESPENDVSGG